MAKYTNRQLVDFVLASDSIDNDAKAQLIKLLKSEKKYGIVWEDKPENAQDEMINKIPLLCEVGERAVISDDKGSPNHVLIEGDNLQALLPLLYSYEGQFDMIYIDPPYNTGAKNWIYNNDYVDKDDSYRHSKWISMMNRRLVIARRLLNQKGVLVLAIDENELATIKLLLEEIFGNGYEIDCITIVQNPRGIQGKNFSYTNEFAIFVIPRGEKIIGDRKLSEEEIDWSPLRNWGGESLREDAKNCFYPIYIKDDKIIGFGDDCDDDYHPEKNVPQEDGSIAVYPIVDGVEHKWRYARQSVEGIINMLRVKRTRRSYDIELGKTFATYKTVWNDSRYDANTYGKKLLNTIIPNCPFDFPKSLYNVYDCLYAVVANNKNALILDFFAGSGTTMHATMQLNEEDQGNRRCILVTNNENQICESITYQRNKNVIVGYTKGNDELVPGLTHNNLRYFKVVLKDNSLTHQNKRELTYSATDLIRVKENCFTEVTSFGDLNLSGKEKLIRYFSESEKKLLIIYDPRVIGHIVKEIQKMNLRDDELKVYIFADGSYPYTEDFKDVLNKVSLIALPYAINQSLKDILPSVEDVNIDNAELSEEEKEQLMNEAIEAESNE